MRNLRRVSQVLSFGLFVWLLLRTELPRDRFDITNSVPPPVDLYFQLDPLHFLSTSLAARQIQTGLLLGLVTILVTVALGRVFCGWICPMGALSQVTGWLWRRVGRLRDRVSAQVSTPRQRWKYVILSALLAGALFQINQVGLLDPLSLTYRSFTTGLIPALERGMKALFDASPAWLSGAIAPVRQWSENHLFAFQPVHFRQGLLLGTLFLGLLAASMAVPRLWCRWLCPLGGLLGLLSRHQALRVRVDSEICTECGLCNRTCEGAADPHRPGQWLAHECLMCWNCVPACPQGGIAISFPRARRAAEPGVDLGRRQVLGALALGLVIPPMLRVASNPKRVDPRLVRPPGALPEPQFLARCVKCGECMKVCPTNFLQEASLEGGFEALWSPVGVPTSGYCSYECSLCGQVCPTGAIEELALPVKKKVKIGLAFIIQSRCLPWSFDTPCTVCEEHCPVPHKAIWLEEVESLTGPEGETLLRPYIDPDLCTGCAECAYVCPVVDRPAIEVTSIGESRSPFNRLTLNTEPRGGRQRRRRGGQRRRNLTDESPYESPYPSSN
jgi:ferredoxin